MTGDTPQSLFARRVMAVLEQQGRTLTWLQREAGYSRSTLYRILNGKSRVSFDDRQRIADALGVLPATLDEAAAGPQWEPTPDAEDSGTELGAQLEEYVTHLDRILRTLRTMPGGPVGQRVKIGFLNGVEDAARETGNKLPKEFWEIRAKVHEGQL